METDDAMMQRGTRQRSYLPREHGTLPDDLDHMQKLLSSDYTLRSGNISERNISSRENIPLDMIVSDSSSVDIQPSNLRVTYRSECASQNSSRHDGEYDDSSTDEEEAYRKLKRRYRRRGFFASLKCCAPKGDSVDGDEGSVDYEDRMAELRYEKTSLAERRGRYREYRLFLEGDQVDAAVLKCSCMTRTMGFFSNLFSKLNALRYVKKLIQARGGGSVAAVFGLLQTLMALNFMIGLLFLGVVFLPDLILSPVGTSGRCNETAVPVGHSSTCTEFIFDCEAGGLQRTPMKAFWDMLEGGYPIANSKLFAGCYDIDHNTYSTDKAYFICLTISYALSICIIVRALVSWLQLRQRFKFSDSRNTITTLLFKGWNFAADAELGRKSEQMLLSQEISSIKNEVPGLNFDPMLARKRMIIHVVSAIFTLVGLSSVAVAICFITNKFIISIIITGLGKIADVLFSWLGKQEQRPNHDELFWLILRGLSFHLMAIGVMAFSELVLSQHCSTLLCTCWEIHYAQQIYSMVLTIGVREVTKLTVVPLLQLIAAKTCQGCVKASTCARNCCKIDEAFASIEPGYEADSHLYNLIELQTLCWMSLPVSPMMPLLVCLVLLLSLFVNMSIVLFLKLRPKIWFGQARSTSFFATALLLSWVMCIWPVMKVMFQRKPSSSCTPFRDLEQQYRAIFSVEHDLVLLLVLMLGFMEAAFLMLFFILRHRAVPVPKSKTRKAYPGSMNERRRATE